MTGRVQETAAATAQGTLRRDLEKRLGAKLGRFLAPRDDETQRFAARAPNAIEWVVGAEYIDAPDVYRHWRQYEIVRDFFQLRCPICNAGDPACWGKSREVLESEVLLVWDEDNHDDTCPRCSCTRSELVDDGLLKSYNILHLVCGMRSGKSTLAAIIFTYVEHVVLTIAHRWGVQSYLGLPAGEQFEMTMLASTDLQGVDTAWAKYRGLRANSPWFQRYVPFVKKLEAEQVVPKGMQRWEYAEHDKKIVNGFARLKINSMNSNSAALVGRTRIAAVADEISRMNQTDSVKSATEVYRGLDRSLRTVRSRAKTHAAPPWFGAMISVTSPVSRDDKGMQLLRSAADAPSMLAAHYATWEFNPFEPLENFAEEYARDPIGAARDFGAEPPGAEYPLIHDEARWKKLAVDLERRPSAEFEIYRRVAPTGQRYLAARTTRVDYARDGAARFVSFDAGANWDAFAGACAHGEYEKDESGKERMVTVFDWVVRIVPEAGTEVFFDSVVDIMRHVSRSARVARCEFDRWQSIQLIQQIRELGIFSEQHSTTSADFVQLKIDSFSGLVRLLPPCAAECDLHKPTFAWRADPPQLSAPAAALYELTRLQCDPDTHKVSNPSKGKRRGYDSNDTAQVIVHCHRLVQSQGYTVKHDDRSVHAARIRAEQTGAGWEDRGTVLHVPHRFLGSRSWSPSRRGW